MLFRSYPAPFRSFDDGHKSHSAQASNWRFATALFLYHYLFRVELAGEVLSDYIHYHVKGCRFPVSTVAVKDKKSVMVCYPAKRVSDDPLPIIDKFLIAVEDLLKELFPARRLRVFVVFSRAKFGYEKALVVWNESPISQIDYSVRTI